MTRDLLLFSLAINTGMNLVDLLALKVKDVKDKDHIYLKYGIKYSFPDDILDLLSRFVENKNKSQNLFISERTNDILDRGSVYLIFKEVCKNLNLKNYSVNSWRKTFGYHYYQKFNDLTFLSWYFGHNSIEQTVEYLDIDDSLASRYKEGLCL